MVLVVVASWQVVVSGNSQTTQADQPLEQVRKNIQVLKGIPSSQLLPIMHFMRTSLGVRCDYCHIAENGKYWMDDKPAKQTARKMLRMVFEINQNNFGGQPVVTCNTCHRGSTTPLPVPGIGQGAFTDTTREDQEIKKVETLPGSDAVLERYIEALGGRAAIDKIKTQTTVQTLLRPKLINSGTPKAAMLNRGESWTMEVFQKAPDKYLSVITTPDGIFRQGFNGQAGWIKTPTAQRQMNSVELARIKAQADFYSDFKLKERYSTLSVIGRERLGNHEVYVVQGRSLTNQTEKLFFDIETGLLLRRVVFTEIKLGLDPEQIDYEDYRKVDGRWLPFLITTSYLDDNHFGTTRRVTAVKHNVQIDETRFNPPTP